MLFTKPIFSKKTGRKNEHLILLHGKKRQIITNNFNVSSIDNAILDSTLSRQPRSLLLLASPFFHSFVHETIHLTRKELRQADEQVLQVSQTPLKNRFVVSIHINEEKAITIHSHLSHQGVALIQHLKKKKLKVFPKPAIQTIIQNYLSSFPYREEVTPHFQLFFENEALRLFGQLNRPTFDLAHYWNREDSQLDREEQMRQLFSERNEPSTTISFSFETEKGSSHIRQLFFPQKKAQRLKIVTATTRRRPLNIQKIINPIPLLTLFTTLLLCWAVFTNLRLSQQIKRKQTMTKSLKALENSTDELIAIADIERGYFKLRSLKKAIQEVKVKPHLLVDKLEQILPDSVWIHTLTITPQSIFIILLDSGETEITKLLEQLNTDLGKTNLEKNEAFQINNHLLKQYHLRINDFSLDILR
jgi:hypothetical protein